ncbi:uncharacterized protein HMPREF1541_02739 [Cyphellophora europaea CBS 101466]|uniref:Defect at low temperature protein 1 n=1 Tax=Cyphellophora europaea (strain CBS 101466) TaxID=1220924 RepID=W2S4Q5_CYPE1|nr:uncharacterized protein HMPREF1541_02739 [Cyphellophora europaea CBS 101466]ETN43580.1 hypothetical protein HMPREF1541_02739 [Cyphellophora europaea CBS 101466]
MARTREVLFKIFYSSSFTAVFLLLIAFVGVAPADKLYESYHRRRVIDIIIVAAAWVLTALIAAFLYGTRLYTNRSILRDIPKTFLPIEREDLPGRNVHRLIQETFARSAVVAYHAKPRSRRIETELEGAGERMLVITKQIKQHHHEHSITPHERVLLEPQWGTVVHAGWQSPASDEMANLEYAGVADELIDLIEAKAVSLAPGDSPLALDESGVPQPDARIVDMLARPPDMGMRNYLAELADVGMLPDADLTDEFVSTYEYSRFSGKPLTETEFQGMMRMFAELLRSMTGPAVDLLTFSDDEGDDIDAKPRSSSPSGNSSLSASSIVHNPSAPLEVYEDSVPSMSSTSLDEGTHSMYTTYTAPQSASHSQSRPQQSFNSRPSYVRQGTSRSRPSLRQTQSNNSFKSAATSRSSRSAGTQGSVIRLVTEDAANRDVGLGLPYEISVNGFGSSREGRA